MEKTKYINKQNPKARWDSYYENYDKKTKIVSFIELVNRNYFTPMFRKELYRIVGKQDGMKILEPGCGGGLMSASLAKNNEVTVLDFSQNALDMAKQNFDSLNVKGNFVKGDLFDMPFEDNTFDVVWNQGVLEHFSDPVDAMKEMYRVTKPGGYVIIFIPAFLSPLHFVWITLSALNLKKLWPFDEQDFFTKKQFIEHMNNSDYPNPKRKRLSIKSFGMSQVGFVHKPKINRVKTS